MGARLSFRIHTATIRGPLRNSTGRANDCARFGALLCSGTAADHPPYHCTAHATADGPASPLRHRVGSHHQDG